MKTLSACIFFLCANISFAQVTNLRAGLWSDASSWSSNALPGINDTVSLSYDIVIDMNANCRFFEANGHHVTVNTGFNLNVVGNNMLPDSTFTDARDGQVYTFRHIGTQVWMTKNLNYTTGNSWCYNNDTTNGAVYGRLYDWNTALTAAPAGWHLPSRQEWETLVFYLGDMFSSSGDMMKEAGYAHWRYYVYHGVATNASGFTALPGGDLEFGNTTAFYALGQIAYFWSSTSLWPQYAWACELQKHTPAVTFSDNLGDWKANGYSVRCIRY